jgi:hypothetical protein
MRSALEVAEQGANDHEYAICITALGEALLNNGELAEAKKNLEAGLAGLERVDDSSSRAWCLWLLCRLEVRRQDVEAVRSLSSQARNAGMNAKMPVWLAAVTAVETWIAWKDGRPQEVVRLAREAGELYATSSHLAPALIPQFPGMLLWPLIFVHLASSDVTAAVEAAAELVLDPSLSAPDELASLVRNATKAWGHHREKEAAKILSEGLELASQLGYC